MGYIISNYNRNFYKRVTLKSVTAILDYCENFESARRDGDKLSKDKPTIGAIEEAGLPREEIIAAISAHKKGKQKNNPQHNVELAHMSTMRERYILL